MWFVSRDGLMWFEYSAFLMDTVVMSSLLWLLRNLTNLNVGINFDKDNHSHDNV